MDTRCLIYLGGLHVHSISSIAATKKTTDRWMVLSATIIVYMPSLPMCLHSFHLHHQSWARVWISMGWASEEVCALYALPAKITLVASLGWAKSQYTYSLLFSHGVVKGMQPVRLVPQHTSSVTLKPVNSNKPNGLLFQCSV